MTETVVQDGDVPAPGQLVTVRNRVWVASDVVQGTMGGRDGGLTARAPHLVDLVSVEDDAWDERLRVIWELEPGAVAHDRHDLPAPAAGYDDPRQLDAFLDAVRWGAIASADRTVLQAPFRSGIEIADYQLDPVVRALSMPRTNLLIADDVGLGKTIEAGLVMQELTLRHRARTMLIVCPAGLTLQWRDEMRDKFGLDFTILDTALLKRLRRSRGLYVNPWTHHPRLIVSIDWLKRERPRRLLRDVLPDAPKYPRTFDMLVVDEVHTCAPTTRGRYAVDSLRTRAVKELAPHCEHRLFLSATPHNGYQESWTALLELLDDQRFARNVPPSDEQLARIMVRRLKRDLPPKWDGTARFPERVPGYLEADYSKEERDAHQRLAEYAGSRRDSADGDAGRAAADFVTTLLKKRLFSSPKAFFETVGTHLETMAAKEAGGEHLRQASKAAGQSVLKPLIDRLEETSEEDDAYATAENDAFTAVRNVTAPLSADERKLLVALRDWAGNAKDRTDAKFAAFRAWLDPILKHPDGTWTGERVIVFTEYRDTQHWLRERLLAAGYPAERLAQLYGGQDTKDRERIKNVFQESPDLPGGEVRILLATDAASEGINLQNHCHRLVHWEIPWNPNRLEQRNGRVDRHGQPSPRVDVLHFVPKGWDTTGNAGYANGSLEDELYFLHVAARKVEQIREDLGSAGDVIAAQVEQKMLGRRVDWQTADTEIAQRAGRAALKVKRELAQDLQRLADTLTGSRTRLNLSPATVERVVRTALRLEHNKDLLDAPAPPGFTGACFRVPPLTGSWADARNDGLHHPVTGEERVVTFDGDAAAGRSDVVLLHLGNRLVQMCLRLLRAELWSGAHGVARRTGLSRVTARVVPGDLLRTPAVAAHIRVVMTGAEGTRLHEEILLAGGVIEGGALTRVKAEDLQAWLAAATDETPPQPLLDTLTGLWPEIEPRLARILDTRVNQRKGRLDADLAARCEEEVQAMREVLAELQHSIRATLDDDDQWEQPSLFEIEQEQLRADHQALRDRLAAIPEQLKHETSALERRYAKPRARWFPAAVTFLVPAAIAHQHAHRSTH
ncbi:DISARM system SNF2-like helicase DrmD [Actinomadura rugatobispora]|uniref:DISARM system SNF2-like helicase DrmD n=1 Tax=Actinomadura rugatobispora TaxID=1994 RepID=A0ABW1ADI8_9ACTN|nr:DISARM system SNF2-like helicase DrmD [Actinomadura rugatobispora]